MTSVKFLLTGCLLLVALSFSIAMGIHQTRGGGIETYGSIEGSVTDQANLPISGASIEACNIMHGGCMSALTQPNGSYRILALPAGRYSLWAEAKRHTSEWIPSIVVEEGQATRQDIQLRRDIPTMSVEPSTVQ